LFHIYKTNRKRTIFDFRKFFLVVFTYVEHSTFWPRPSFGTRSLKSSDATSEYSWSNTSKFMNALEQILKHLLFADAKANKVLTRSSPRISAKFLQTQNHKLNLCKFFLFVTWDEVQLL
jgi:ATP-dependent exoDNAse (exonuclease V) beta subunit